MQTQCTQFFSTLLMFTIRSTIVEIVSMLSKQNTVQCLTSSIQYIPLPQNESSPLRGFSSNMVQTPRKAVSWKIGSFKARNHSQTCNTCNSSVCLSPAILKQVFLNLFCDKKAPKTPLKIGKFYCGEYVVQVSCASEYFSKVQMQQM